jgi:hypothetical protein
METTTTTTTHRARRLVAGLVAFIAASLGHHGSFGDHAAATSSPSYVVDYTGSANGGIWTIDGIPFGSSVTEDSPIVPLFVGVTS